jgi:transposase
MPWTAAQTIELQRLAKSAPQAYVRVKAAALLGAAHGHSYTELADVFGIHRETIGRWAARYRRRGAASFAVAPGRGRRARADLEVLAHYVRQSPRQFGLTQTRWTLRALAQTVPSLGGMCESSVLRALQRAGFRYKRGQPTVHSPDPAYGEKRGGWSRRSTKRTVTRTRSSSSSRTR